jgi:hypothetical protein
MKFILLIAIVIVFITNEYVLSYQLKSSLSSYKKSINKNIQLYANDQNDMTNDLWYDRIQYVDLNANVEPSSTARSLPLFLLGKIL